MTPPAGGVASVRLSAEVLEALDAAAAATGSTRAEVMRQRLSDDRVRIEAAELLEGLPTLPGDSDRVRVLLAGAAAALRAGEAL